MQASAQRERARLTGEPGLVLITHGGGNTLDRAHQALTTAAQYIEIDLFVHDDRLEARHERRFPAGIPVLFERWYFQFAPKVPFDLAALIEITGDRCGLFLDLKNAGPAPARLVRRALDDAHAIGRVAASSQHWGALRALRRVAPEVALYYSIDVPAKLDLFFSVIERDGLPDGVSCQHRLLDAHTVDRLHDRGLSIVAWTVDDLDRARELARLGVDAITTHTPLELRAAIGL